MRYLEVVSRYTYARGERVTLEPDDERVAVDVTRASRAGLQDLLHLASRAGIRLGPGILLVPRATFDEQALDRLARAGARRGVYRHGAVVVVPLPEVRIELEPGQLEAVRTSLPAAFARVAGEVVEDSGDRLVLRPVSGIAEDALDLANAIQESAHPAAASVRMLQLVPRPEPRPSPEPRRRSG